MKKLAKFCLILSLLGTAVMPVFAQERVEMAAAASYKANWGQREVTCTSLSNDAVAFYRLEDSYAYEDMCLNAGTTVQSNVPQSALYRELQSMMKSEHSKITTYNGTKDMYQYTDCVTSNTSKVSVFYLGELRNSTWNGSTYNREHTWPKSKGVVEDSTVNDTADIMTLRATDNTENSRRGNKAYGEGSSCYDPNKNGQKVRGDCARMILYTYVRWGNAKHMWGTSGVMESKDILLKWMEEDPVDTWEMGRNDAVQSITGTRNVFVDYPEYAWLLFGEKVPTNMVTPSGKASGGTATPDLPDTPVTPDVPDTPTTPTTPAEIVKAAYALASGAMLPGTHTLTGEIIAVDSYTNPTIVVEGMEDKPLYCFKLRDNRFEVGDTITVRGTIKNYNGTVEFDTPTLIELITGQETPDTPVTPDEPDTPVTPDTPDTPDVPVTPDTPNDPDRPELPEEDENACAHEYGEWFIIIPATQETEGEKERYCELCGDKQSETIPCLTEEDVESGDESDDTEEDSDKNSGALGGLNIGCQSTIGGSLAGIALAAAGMLLIKRKKENE